VKLVASEEGSCSAYLVYLVAVQYSIRHLVFIYNILMLCANQMYLQYMPLQQLQHVSA